MISLILTCQRPVKNVELIKSHLRGIYLLWLYMSTPWIKECLLVKKELGCSYKEAMIEASRRRNQKGTGAIWNLDNKGKERYLLDKQRGVNQKTQGDATFWKQ